MPTFLFNEKRVRRLARLSVVPRWAIVPTVKTQSVAEHSFNVMWICSWLYEKVGRTINSEALLACMFHDESEAITGDIPSPVKKSRFQDREEELEKEHHMGSCAVWNMADAYLVGLADLLEAVAFLHREKRFGNNHVKDILKDLAVRAQDMWSQVGNPDVFIVDELVTIIENGHPGMECT